MKECPPDPVQMARQILDYLSRQPSEQDTLEGIAHHVLPEKPTTRQETLVKEAAGDLVTQGLVERLQEAGRTLYRVRSRS